MSEARKPFKLWFDEALVEELGGRIAAVEPRFAREAFAARAVEGLDALEMMARVGQIADALHAALPRPTAAAMRALVASLTSALPDAEGVTEQGYRFWPYGEYIARHGLDDVDASFEAMLELTQRFTSEFAVRPFLAAEPDAILDRLEALLDHPSEHVRRFISEGTRTRLPWGKRVPALEARAKRRLRLLAALRHDPSRYVQRSVANHLQDILKDDRALALPHLTAWSSEGQPSTDWIARHAARGLLKAGDPEVLALFGQGPSPDIVVTRFAASTARVRIGESVELDAAVRNEGWVARSVRLDYRLESPGAGARPTRKTFRFADLELAPGEKETRTKRHEFAHRSIRTVRPGEHRLTLEANGVAAAELVIVVR